LGAIKVLYWSVRICRERRSTKEKKGNASGGGKKRERGLKKL